MCPSAKRRAVLLPQENFEGLERFARIVVGPLRSTQHGLLSHETPTDPDRWLRTHLDLSAHGPRNTRKGRRRPRSDLRGDGSVVNRKKVQRIYRERGFRVDRKA